MRHGYAVKHKLTGKFFAGFSEDKSPLWADTDSKARQYADWRDAHGQAQLLAMSGVPAQRKPVAASAA